MHAWSAPPIPIRCPSSLHRPAPAGLLMEQLLEPLVDAKTLSATLKYLGLLWNDKLHEELIESVNPLSEIGPPSLTPAVAPTAGI